MTRFELATSASRTLRSTKLSHTPLFNYCRKFELAVSASLRSVQTQRPPDVVHPHRPNAALYQTEPHPESAIYIDNKGNCTLTVFFCQSLKRTCPVRKRSSSLSTLMLSFPPGSMKSISIGLSFLLYR